MPAFKESYVRALTMEEVTKNLFTKLLKQFKLFFQNDLNCFEKHAIFQKRGYSINPDP